METQASTNARKSTLEEMASYDKGSKACINNYTTKTFYSTQVQPFFRQGTGDLLSETAQIKALNLDKKVEMPEIEKAPVSPVKELKDDKKKTSK